MPTPRRPAPAAKRPGMPKPPRVRRGNLEDQASLRAQVVGVAFDIFRRQGMQALTMRAVAAEVGVSAMALYRYFAGKGELLRGLWDFVLVEIRAELDAAEAPQPTAEGRAQARLEAFIHYWESHPDHYRLVYATPQTLESGESPWTATPLYLELLETGLQRLQELATAIGGDPRHARMARDMQHCLVQGYLYSRIVNERYPWADLDAMRAEVIVSVMQAVKRCLKGGASAA
ncbi:MAG: TetR/AcrR family transcriptional regulator [Aquabacterium sp.]|nr:MAG: TetR/AcrR family transcriptional regulator [Aquabacterium sp.]